MSDETAEPHMQSAIAEIVDGNHWAAGDYLLVAEATVDEGGLLYTWRWAWSPKAQEHTGTVENRPGA